MSSKIVKPISNVGLNMNKQVMFAFCCIKRIINFDPHSFVHPRIQLFCILDLFFTLLVLFSESVIQYVFCIL
jgi:hypothetical protein